MYYSEKDTVAGRGKMVYNEPKEISKRCFRYFQNKLSEGELTS